MPLKRLLFIMQKDLKPVSPSPIPEPEPAWTPRLPTTSTYAWVTSVDQDGSFLVQETPGAPKYRAKRAQSCPSKIRRGDLVCIVTDGYFHYAISVLHRQSTPALQLLPTAHAS